MASKGKKLIIVLVSLSLLLGVAWTLTLSFSSPSQKEEQKLNPVIKDFVASVKEMADIYEQQGKFLSDLKATEPMYIWGREYATDTEKLLGKTPQWKTLGKVDYKRASDIMSSSTSTLEDRLYAMSMGYLSMVEELFTTGKGTLGTIDMGNSSISGVDALVRARAGAYTLIDWKTVEEKTTTQAKLSFIKDKAKDWEESYKNLQSLLTLEEATPRSVAIDIGSTYMAIYNLRNISTTTYKNADEILQGKSQDTTLQTIDKSTLMFLLYSAEYPRVGIEILSTLKQMELSDASKDTITKDDALHLCENTWKEIEKTLNITLPETLGATESATLIDNLSKDLEKKLGLDYSSVGMVLVSRMFSNYKQYQQQLNERNPDIYYLIYLTGSSRGIADFLTEHKDLAQTNLLSAPTSTSSIPSSLAENAKKFTQIYAWMIDSAKKNTKNIRTYPLIADTYISISSIGYTASQKWLMMRDTIEKSSDEQPTKLAGKLVGIYTSLMIDTLYNLIDTLTIEGVKAMLSGK